MKTFAEAIMTYIKYTIIGLLCLGGVVTCSIVSKGCSWLGKAADVAAQQVDPALLLKRYEWFKEVAAECDKKLADIKVYESRLSSMEADYEGSSRKDWDRTDKEQFNLWTQEVAGVIASYNSLAAEYNAAMSKINYSFTNVGQLPKGATEALPREMREYKTK
jgi:hypothetical protein